MPLSQIGTMDSEVGSVNWNEFQLAITVSLGVGVSLTGHWLDYCVLEGALS